MEQDHEQTMLNLVDLATNEAAIFSPVHFPQEAIWTGAAEYQGTELNGSNQVSSEDLEHLGELVDAHYQKGSASLAIQLPMPGLDQLSEAYHEGLLDPQISWHPGHSISSISQKTDITEAPVAETGSLTLPFSTPPQASAVYNDQAAVTRSSSHVWRPIKPKQAHLTGDKYPSLLGTATKPCSSQGPGASPITFATAAKRKRPLSPLTRATGVPAKYISSFSLQDLGPPVHKRPKRTKIRYACIQCRNSNKKVSTVHNVP